MKVLLLFFVILFILGEDYFFPAEWQCEHETMWYAWPSEGIEEFMKGYSIKDTQMEIFKILTNHSVKVTVVVNNENEKEEVLEMAKKNKINVDFLEIPILEHIDIWMRDFGPFFVIPKNSDSEAKEKVLHFDFDNWGMDLEEKDNYTIVDKGVPGRVAKYLGLDLEVANPFIVSEGGDKSFNGNGVLLVTESVELQRNPNYTKKELDEVYYKYYGVEKVIWLPTGVVEDTISSQRVYDGEKYLYTCLTTNGHNDEYCRFVSEDTILIGYVDEEEFKKTKNSLVKENYHRMKTNYDILENETDVEGNKFKVIKFPIPEVEYKVVSPGNYVYEALSELNYTDHSKFPFGKDIEVVLPTSYMNWIVTNGVAIVPQFYKPGKSEDVKKKDERAKKILEQVFPDRKVYGVDTTPLTIGGGALNCISQQQPIVQCHKKR